MNFVVHKKHFKTNNIQRQIQIGNVYMKIIKVI